MTATEWALAIWIVVSCCFHIMTAFALDEHARAINKLVGYLEDKERF